jgi:hypothetical protein
VIEGIGWLATAVFSASYFLTARTAMLATQIGAALLWTSYGVLTRAAPVVAANLIVVGAAALSIWRTRQTSSTTVATKRPPSSATRSS